eukprot:3978-Heterococcus_DN1.PRE.3
MVAAVTSVLTLQCRRLVLASSVHEASGHSGKAATQHCCQALSRQRCTRSAKLLVNSHTDSEYCVHHGTGVKAARYCDCLLVSAVQDGLLATHLVEAPLHISADMSGVVKELMYSLGEIITRATLCKSTRTRCNAQHKTTLA